TGGRSRSTQSFPYSGLGNAELVPLYIPHVRPDVPAARRNLLNLGGAKRNEPFDLGLSVRGPDVQVQAILDGLVLWDDLKIDHRVSPRPHGNAPLLLVYPVPLERLRPEL